MSQINFQKQVLPHIIAIGVFLIITVGFFSPVFFKNQDLRQGDINQWRGGAQELIEYREQTGKEGLWTNSMFSGMPGYLVDVKWNDKIIEGLHRVYTFGLPHPVRMIFAALLSFYILGLSFKVRPYFSIIGAISFALSSYMIIGIGAGHNARIGAIAYMPLIIAGIHLVMTDKRWLGVGVTTAAMALHLRLNHLQITYYLLLIVLLYGLIQLIHRFKSRELKRFAIDIGLLTASVLIALASFFGELWATYEFSKYSTRGKSELTKSNDTVASTGAPEGGLEKWYAFQYSNGIIEPMTLIIPNFMGGASYSSLLSDEDSNTLRALQRSGDQQTANQLAQFARAYWGEQSSAAPYYAGAICFLLFVIGVALAERRYKIWLLTVLVLGIILSWGSNFAVFNYTMFDYFPGYNKFRSVTFTILFGTFSMSLLGCLGLEKLFSVKAVPMIKKKLLLSGAISAGICVFFILIAGMMSLESSFETQLPAWFSRALQQDRAVLLRGDALRSLLFISISFVAIWGAYEQKFKLSILPIVLVFATSIDVWGISSRYLNKNFYERRVQKAFFQPTEADKIILDDPDPNYRVVNLPNIMSDARTSYHHKSIGGYHGAKLGRYQELFDHATQQQTEELINMLRAGEMNLSSLGVLNMLNAKYYVAGGSAEAVISNPFANGHAWIVSKIEPVSNADEEIAKVKSGELKTRAIIDQTKFEIPNISSDPSDEIELRSYAPGELKYNAKVKNQALAVFSEIYYEKGWEAFIDGEPTDIYRANYVLRAIVVPPGEHEIKFQFRPKAYTIGNKITLVGNVLVLLVILGSIWMEVKKTEFPDPKNSN